MSPNSADIVNLSSEGTFRPSKNLHTPPEAVDAIFERLAGSEEKHLCLYFHGGMVDEATGIAIADRLAPGLERAGVHPVFFVWESGLLETLAGKVEQAWREAVFRESRRVLDPLAEWLDAKDQDQLTPEDEAYLAEEISSDRDLEREVRRIAENRATLMSDDVLAGLEAQDAADAGLSVDSAFVLSLMGVAIRCWRRRRAGTDHGVHCTFVEEMLRGLYLDNVCEWVWGGMKRTIRKAFDPNDKLAGDDLHGGTYFIDRLNEFVRSRDGKDLRVSLVGHSAGGIYICRFLRDCFQRLPSDFRFAAVAMMAPGCDFELFDEIVVTNGHRIRLFRMFALRDDLETRDELCAAYPRSPMYFVCAVCEGERVRPFVGMQRFHTMTDVYAGKAFESVRSFVSASATGPRAVWATLDGQAPGLNSGTRTHMGFDEDDLTLDSIAALLEEASRLP